MNILNKIATKNLRLNKKRSISTIIAIMLSVALICAVAAMGTSFQKTLVQNEINTSGYYHMELSNLTKKDVEELNRNQGIKDMKTVYDIGYSYFNYEKEKDGYLHVYSFGDTLFKDLAYEIVEGKEPTNENEIAISRTVMAEAKYKIGDTIRLEVGTRQTKDGYPLKISNPVHLEEEKIVDTKPKTYKIVGIVKNSKERDSYYGVTIKETSDEINAYCAFKNPKDYKEVAAKILGIKTLDNYEEAKYSYRLNHSLLRWEIFAVSDSTTSMLYAVVGVVIFIIIFTSVFCIRNSFAIATTEKTKMYGMLASIGATKKQIKKSVLFEAMILGLIGIPLGILSGIFAVFVLIQIVNFFIGHYLFDHIDGVIMSVTMLPILASVLLGFVTIYLSAKSSARRASKISPIEQLRNTNDIKLKNKKLKTPKIIQKLFGVGGVIAYKNLKRSKKKYKTTVISLAVSIFVFITMNSFVTNVFDFTGNYYREYNYNILIYGNFGNLKDLSKGDIQKIGSIEGVTEYFCIYGGQENLLEISDESRVNTEDGITMTDMEMKGIDDASFRKYAKRLGLDYEEVKKTGILRDTYLYYDQDIGNTKKMRRYTYEKGDVITGKFAEQEKNIKVGAVTETKPYGLEEYSYYGGYLIVNVDEYQDLDLQLGTIAIQSSKPEKTVAKIKEQYKNINVNNLDEMVRMQKGMVIVINIFLYGFIIVITLIGVTNIFNTITSNMELRQKEFAMLKSIGMTKREFNRMINLETIFYGTKALIYGVILGLIGTFAIYKAFSLKIDSGLYIPVIPIIISAIFVFVIVFVIMRYSIHKINGQNTIETIRKENV